MAVTTQSANALASALSKSLGRPITAKMVRTIARSVLPAHDKTKHPEYQAHAYSAADAQRIRATLAARGSRTVAKPAPKRRAKRTAPATVATE